MCNRSHVFSLSGWKILFGPLIEQLYPLIKRFFMSISKNSVNCVLWGLGLTVLVCFYLIYSTEVNSILKWLAIQHCTQCISSVLTVLFCWLLLNDYKYNRCVFCRFSTASIIVILTICSGFLCVHFSSLVIFACLVVAWVAYYIYARNIRQNVIALRQEEQEDWLYRERIFNRTHLQIRKLAQQENKGLTIGICGQWGSGKSFFIDSLKQKLSKKYTTKDVRLFSDEFTICSKVELWEASSLDEAWNRVVSSLYKGVMGWSPFDYAKFAKVFISILSLFSTRFTILGEIIKLVHPDYSARNLSEIKKKMKSKRVVLIFDDLERADVNIIKAMLPLFERLKELPNLIVLCAVAEEEMKQVFQGSKLSPDFVHGHLDKLFDLRIEIPKPTYTSIEYFLMQSFNSKYEDCKLVRTFLREYPLRFNSVRQMHRVLEKITSIERQYFSTCPYDFVEHSEEDKVIRSLISIKYTFLIECLRLVSPSVLKELKKQLRIDKLFKEIPLAIVSPSKGIITKEEFDWDWSKSLAATGAHKQEEIDKEAKWEENHPELYQRIVEPGILNSIFVHIKGDFEHPKYSGIDYEGVYKEALSARYTRCMGFAEWEYEEILDNPYYRDMSYSCKVNTFFAREAEILEKPYQTLAAFSLFERHVSKLLHIDLPPRKVKLGYEVNTDENAAFDSLLEEIEVSLMNERNDVYSRLLRDSTYLDARYFSNFLESFWDIKEKVKEFTWKKVTQICSYIFDLMPIGEKGSYLAYYFDLATRRFESKKISYFDTTIAPSADHAILVLIFCKLYGEHLARHIAEYPASLAREQSQYTFACQAYREATGDKYIEEIKLGIDEFISQYPHKSIFIERWVNFMGHQYRSASIRGGIMSSFANYAVYDQMAYIESKLNISCEYIMSLSNREDIHKACMNSMSRLREDYNQWKDDKDEERKEKYSSGIIPMITLISKISNYTTTK